ncbi:MAG: response regulator [Deltaproteobacteria bacterium]|nr:response regulator [Deltaproteobacteria bacterium]
MSARVLVVDDSATIRRLVRTVLEESGYEVSTALDGQMALDLLRRESFDLLLIDFVMPRLNGYQLAMAVRAMPSIASIPIILMSAKADTIGAKFLQQTRSSQRISKPFEPNALLTVIEETLRQRTSQPQRPQTLVSHELGVGQSIAPPPAFAPERSARTQAPIAANAPSPFASATSASATPNRTADTLFVRPRTDTVLESLPSFAAPTSALDDQENTFVGQLPFGFEMDPSLDDDPVENTDLRAVIQDESPPRLLVRKLLSMIAGQGYDALDHLEDPLVDSLTDDELRDLLGLVREALGDRELVAGLQGRIDSVPLAEVMQLLRFQQQSGVLVVRRGGAIVDLCFHRGAIDLALARNVSSEFLLGRYAVAGGVISREELDEILNNGLDERLGAYLLRSGRLDAEGLERLLTRQASEILYEVCRWRDGSFEFFAGLRPTEAQEAALGLPVEMLVLEGFRRVDEWSQIEQELHSFDDVFTPDYSVIENVGLARLSPSERRVLDALDGARTVNDLIAATAMNSFDACKTLFQLRRARLIRRRNA